jgi:hypothetical protein
MTTHAVRNLRELCLRSNPAWELVLFDRLAPAEQQTLAALGRDPDGYGVLRPRKDAGLGIKSVTRDVALLWLTLLTPGPLPRYAIQSMGDECDRIIGQMILDGIFAIDQGGDLLSGPAACALVCAEQTLNSGENRLAALSRRALLHGEALEITEVAALSSRLYMYNHVPVSHRWRSLLPNQAAVERQLGLDTHSPTKMAERGWKRLRTGGERWLAWQAQRKKQEHDSATTYKLYVSPACHEVRAGFQAAAESAAESRAFYLKVGSDVHGLLRPDKIVVYFRDFADLQETAAQVMEKLEHCPAHGVPFTAEIGGDGLLSWGIDPPAERHAVAWLERESWRQRISNILACALTIARTAGINGIAATSFAMERLRLEGIDTETWAPTRGLSWAHKHQDRPSHDRHLEINS